MHDRETHRETSPFDGWPPALHFEHAACRAPDVEPAWWFPARGESTELARKVCAGCTHQLACRDYGLRLPAAATGIFGGLSSRERITERRARRRELALELRSAEHDHERIDEPAPDLVTSPSDELPATNGSARTCSICGTELAPNRQRTCGPECAAEHERRREAERKSTRKREPALVNGTADARVAAWPQPLAALVDAGAVIESVSLHVDGTSWTLTRSQ